MDDMSASVERGASPEAGAAPPYTEDKKKIRYTCPMHPQIVQVGPGNCPICVMALEPLDVFAELEAAPVYDSMRLRFWIIAALSLHLLLLAIVLEPLCL